VPDVVQVNAELGAANPAGKIHTGLAGSGCTVSTTASSTDPLLPTTTMFAGLVLWLRRKRSKQ